MNLEKTFDDVALDCRGRNGWFILNWSRMWFFEDKAGLSLFSRRYGQMPPIMVTGAPHDLLAALEHWTEQLRQQIKEVEDEAPEARS